MSEMFECWNVLYEWLKHLQSIFSIRFRHAWIQILNDSNIATLSIISNTQTFTNSIIETCLIRALELHFKHLNLWAHWRLIGASSELHQSLRFLCSKLL